MRWEAPPALGASEKMRELPCRDLLGFGFNAILKNRQFVLEGVVMATPRHLLRGSCWVAVPTMRSGAALSSSSTHWELLHEVGLKEKR